MAHTLDIIKYWRASCVDSERSNIDPRKLEEANIATYKIRPMHARSGMIPLKTAQGIFSTIDEETTEGDADQERICQVLISPLLLFQEAKSGRLNKHMPAKITPLWIPANLHEDGRLTPRSGSFPWVPRDLLDPSHLPCDIILGSVEAVDNHLTNFPFPAEWENWEHLWDASCSLFRAVTGKLAGAFALDGYSVQETSIVVVDEEFRGSARHIVSLYDYLVRLKEHPPLLNRFATMTEALPSSLMGAREQLAMSARHLGQMNDKFGLMPSQREALNHFFAVKDGNVLAVNGPPGTGKTTFIQSLVASLWVESAIFGNEPPLIVATSANNQAVRNVIDSFGKSDEIDSPLAGRWIPNVTSYGLYLKSDSASGFDADKFQCSNVKGDGFPSMIETEEGLEAASRYFLERCREYAGVPITDLGKARQFLYDRLEAVSVIIRRGLEGWEQLLQHEDMICKKYGNLEGVSRYIEGKEKEAESYEVEAMHYASVLKEWHNYVDKEPFWMTLFSFLPPVKKRRALRYRLFLREQALDVMGDVLDVEDVSDAIIASRNQALELKFNSLSDKDSAKSDQEAYDEAGSHHMRWRREQLISSDPPEMLAQMDKSLRYMAFKLATHYWEVRWLQEMNDMIRRGDKDTESKIKKIRRLRRYAKLTPCMVSTIFMVPRFYSAYEGAPLPLLETIDLLIVDEAGQVSPEVAGAVFSLAKKAVVVGDTLQIQPVWSISEKVDRGNVHGFITKEPGEAETAYDRGITAYGGDVLTIAKNSCGFGTDGDRGLSLVEHFRCVPEIISYCNELAYHGRLVPMRPSMENHILPHMGWLNVEGSSEREGGSRKNEKEAQEVVDWISMMREKLEAYYKKDICSVVGIVTPFSKQAHLIRELLAAKAMDKLTTGTVHALQGAERKVVIFSSVYGTEDHGPYFFDANKNMLNVAVSRAMDSFLVIGSMAIFDQNRPERPSGLLAKYLFADKNNQLFSSGEIAEHQKLR